MAENKKNWLSSYQDRFTATGKSAIGLLNEDDNVLTRVKSTAFWGPFFPFEIHFVIEIDH